MSLAAESQRSSTARMNAFGVMASSPGLQIQVNGSEYGLPEHSTLQSFEFNPHEMGIIDNYIDS